MFTNLFGKPRPWLDASVAERVETAVRTAEQSTSAEIRVYTERKCSYVDAVDRARELFWQFGMHQTQRRNAVLIYWAVQDKQVAIFADEGIYQQLGEAYWYSCVQQMLTHFRSNDPATALEACVRAVGESLSNYFPYDPNSDRNELSDSMIIGR